jgi:hypothetical protein
MRKIKLDLDALEIASFPTVGEGAGGHGTVHGWDQSGPATCLGQATCASACSWTNGAVACKSCGPCCYE